MLRPRLAAVAATAFVAAAAAPVATADASASPAGGACTGTGGVTVVVDFGRLGGDPLERCVRSGGRSADRLFEDAGVRLEYVQRQPGFVCRVDGQPHDEPCVNIPPATAYWGLWWARSSEADWTYATTGAGSLRVPDGGRVAFAWQQGSGQRSPSIEGAAGTASPADAGPAARQPVTDEDGALPAWVGPAAVAALLVSAAAVAWRRRGRRGS